MGNLNLPTGGFHWVEFRKDRSLKTIVEELVVKKDYGYLLEVNVAYPKELHDYHNDLTFMCAKMKINGVEKLVPSLYYKCKYVIHIKALKQPIDHGLVLERTHRCIEFKQSVWMKEYIDFNTRLRTAAKNDFEKDLYKLMNNSVFGKRMETTRKHRNIKLVNNEEEYLKNVMTPNFKSGTLLRPNLMGCEMGKVKVVMNKPVYLARSFNLCYRYIDDLIVFNNKKFLDYFKEIYPSQLTVEKANKSDHLADYLDLTFIIDSGGKLSTRLYDKRDDFDFHIVNFPYLSSNIPSGPSYGVYISQLIRYARCCSHHDNFRYRHKCLVDRFLSQGYIALRLEKSFKKFYGRYQDLIEKYQRSVNVMVNDSFSG